MYEMLIVPFLDSVEEGFWARVNVILPSPAANKFLWIYI